MKKLEDGAAFLFIVAVAILSVISIMGIWNVFGEDVIWKSFQTLGLLAVVSIVVMVAGSHMEKRAAGEVNFVPELPNPAFRGIRKATLVILIVAVAFLAIIGVLAIWEVVSDKSVLWKAVSSVCALAFGAFIIVITSLQREGNDHMKSSNISGVGVLVTLGIGWLLLKMFLGGY